jgi:hypothetical protein
MGKNNMYEKYFSLAQSFSTQYLAAQVERVRDQKMKFRAFSEALRTRLFINKFSDNGHEKKK